MLNQLIDQYGRRLYGLCLRLCANVPDAEDLYQDTWLKVLQHLDRYEPARSFEPWLTTICVNLYRDRLRRLKRSLSSRTAAEVSGNVSPDPPDYAPLYAAIHDLPESLRLTIILFYFQEQNLQTVAKILRIPPGTVKSRLNRARAKLKEVLQHENLV